MEMMSGDNWSSKTCKAAVKSSPPTNQHPPFYRPDALPVTQPTVSKHWRENITFHGSTQAYLWSYILVLTATQEKCNALSFRFNGNFPGEPGLAGVYWSKGWWRWWWQLDCWSSCKAPVKSSPPTNQHPVFTGRMPFLSPNQQCQSSEGKTNAILMACKISYSKVLSHPGQWSVGGVLITLTRLLNQ